MKIATRLKLHSYFALIINKCVASCDLMRARPISTTWGELRELLRGNVKLREIKIALIHAGGADVAWCFSRSDALLRSSFIIWSVFFGWGTNENLNNWFLLGGSWTNTRCKVTDVRAEAQSGFTFGCCHRSPLLIGASSLHTFLREL